MGKIRVLIIVFIMMEYSSSSFSQWIEISGLTDSCYAGATGSFGIAVDSNCHIYAAGDLKEPNGNFHILEYNQLNWNNVGRSDTLPIFPAINSIYCDQLNHIFIGNGFINTAGFNYIAEWDGNQWSEVGGFNSFQGNSVIHNVTGDDAGNLYVTGAFTNANGKNYVAHFDGNNWSELQGSNQFYPNGIIYGICTDPAGNVYAAGDFTNDSLVTLGKPYVAKFDGTTWTELGGHNSLPIFNAGIGAICSDAAGNIYVNDVIHDSIGNYFTVMRYNGSQWENLGVMIPDGIVNFAGNFMPTHLCSDDFGNVYAVIYQAFGNGNAIEFVMKWDGANWSYLGGQHSFEVHPEIMCIATDKAGNVYVSGSFKDTTMCPPNGVTYVAKYNQPNGVAPVNSNKPLQVYPNPACNQIHIKCNSQILQLQINDLTGKQVYSDSNLVNEVSVNVSIIPEGMYFCTIITKTNRYSKKLVIIH